MRRPRKFLSLVIILMVINAIFFTVWYPLGGRDSFRKYLTDKVSNAVGFKLSFGDLHFSDRQLFAQEVHLSMPDSLVTLDAESVRIRYNLYKLIFSGFKLEGVVSTVEIIRPSASVKYHYQPKDEYKPKSKFKIPDFSQYFDRLTLEGGEVSADINMPLKILQEGDLKIEETLKDIELRVINDKVSKIKLSAVSSLDGQISLEGVLDGGRIDLAEASIAGFRPLYIQHPDIRDFRTELNLAASYSEPADSSAARYSATARLESSSAYVIDRYPLRLPQIQLTADQDDARIWIQDGRIGNSTVVADLKVSDLRYEISFDGSTASFILDMTDIMPSLSGIVNGRVTAGGNLKDPRLDLSASSAQFAFQNWVFNDLKLKADYQDDVASLSLTEGRWENQYLMLEGSFQPKTMQLSARLDTGPLKEGALPLMARGTARVDGMIMKPYPMLTASLSDFDINYQDLSIGGLSANASMTPTDESLFFDATVDADNGFHIEAVGDILDRFISIDADFRDLDIAGLCKQKTLQSLQPHISGSIKAIMHEDKIWLRSLLDTALLGEYDYVGDLDLLASLDLSGMDITAALKTENGLFFGEPLDLDICMNMIDKQLRVRHLKAEDFLNLSGRVNLANWQDMDFDIALRNLDSARLIRYCSDLEFLIPEFKNLNLFTNFNRKGDRQFSAEVNLREIDLISVIPLNLDLSLKGQPEDISIVGEIHAQNQSLLSLQGQSQLLPQVDIALRADFDSLKMQETLPQSPGNATLSGLVDFALNNALDKGREMEFGVDLHASDLKFGDFKIDQAIVKAAQLPRALMIDSLFVKSTGLFEAQAQGSLDYNAMSNLFYEGERSLDISVTGELFPWLKSLTDYIQVSRGSSALTMKIGSDEDQFMVYSGELDIHDGYLHLKDQVEPMRNIEIKGIFDDNRLVIQRGTFEMGNGKFYMNNIFDSESSDHFNLAFLDLGYLRLMIEEPGIQATIPVISPPKTLASVAIRGQSSRYAVVRGPFDDMKIEAHVLASNLDILFPPGADNLLSLIMSVRKTGKKPDSDPAPLPFTMDLLVSIGENVRYVTYPTNLHITPGAYLHLIYDGNRFIVKEANINSERGSIDFFGTVFQVDNIAINMIDQQSILNINGLFYKKTPDGSMITLSVYSTPDFDKNFFDRLQISLDSDNPQDQNISHVLSRLRYNQSMEELSGDQKNSTLQDEALDLIGGNLNASVLTPIFYPVENWIRRSLKLDGFSINAGFIQNLFTEYSSDPSQLADMADLSDFGSDISRFSSAILLNNLSLSMSKYIGYSMFVDYDLMLQEATDLQKKTQILVSHEASLRLALPKQYRLGYTLNYAPQERGFAHGVMLQKSLRFWGL